LVTILVLSALVNDTSEHTFVNPHRELVTPDGPNGRR
jgi:hypothetical protein